MARITVGQKAARVLEFLMGLSNPQIAAALVKHGFTEDDRQQGFALLKRLTDDRLSTRPALPVDATALEALDAWENTWYPLIQSTLRYRHKAVHDAVFLNLTMTSGQELVVTVDLLLRRIEALATSSDADENAAAALLVTRGLTANEIAHARDLVTRATAVRPEAPQPAVSTEEMAARERALWEWYLEWSGIARATLKNRRHLRELGFLRAGAREDEAETAAAAE